MFDMVGFGKSFVMRLICYFVVEEQVMQKCLFVAQTMVAFKMVVHSGRLWISRLEVSIWEIFDALF